ncbi:MAG TPA: EpsI family protein [Planctomycetota bacterium]|nr:EpsI family protein [Planctomycetota bacterium]
MDGRDPLVTERHDVLAARAAEVERAHAIAVALPVSASSATARLVWGTIALAVVIAAFHPALGWLEGRWLDPQGYYGHGPLVPLIALALAWRERARLSPRPDARGRALGSALLLAAALLQVVAAAFRVHFASGIALLLVMASSALLLGGMAFARALAFPLAFLALALPLPMNWIASATLELKLLAASAATHTLELFGMTAVRDGSTVHLAAGDVAVEDVCSGMRSLIALVSMGVLVAGLDRGVPLWRRGVVVALALPVAIAANAVRVAFLCLAVETAGQKVLETWIHEGSGILVYGISLGLLLLARKAVFPGDERPLPAARLLPVAPPAARVAFVAVALVPCAAATLLLDRKPDVKAPPIATAIPAAIGSWTATELPIEDFVRETLQTNDLISRRYVKSGESPVFLYIAASRGDRKVAHPPEVCAPGNGWAVEDETEVELVRGVRAETFMLVRGPERQRIVYFYAAGCWLGPSYVASQLRAALARFRSPDVPSALVRLSAPVRDPESDAEAWRSIRAFAAELLPALEERLGTHAQR